MPRENPPELLERDDARRPPRETDGPERSERSRLAQAAHDLRNPLNAFATSLALLEAVIEEPDDRVRRTLDAMERSVREMQHRLDELVDGDGR